MDKQNSRKFNFLFLIAIANLLAAFGGGTVLHLALTVAKQEPEFQLGWDAPFLALLIGTTIGLVLVGLLNLIKTRWARASRTAGGYLSFLGALVAIAVAILYQAHSDRCSGATGACRPFELYVYYGLLAILFSLLFVPRILRSDATAGYKQKIGWVEFCYAMGIVLALVSWQQIDKQVPDLRTKLYIDAAFQIVAGLIDLASSRLSFRRAAEPVTESKGVVADEIIPRKMKALPMNRGLFAKLTIAAGALTIGIQIVAMEFREALVSDVAPYIFGGFYLGAALSALAYGLVLTKLEFPPSTSWLSSFGVVTITLNRKVHQIKFAFISAATALLLMIAIALNASQFIRCDGNGGCGIASWVAMVAFVPLTVMAAFLFEWLILTILDMVGSEARSKNRDGLVALSFGLMGMGAAVSVIFFSVLEPGLSKHMWWIITLIASVVVANLAVRSIRKRGVLPLTPAEGTPGSL